AMRLQKCWFCSSNIYPGHGICFVRNDSTEFRFCRSKCHKAFKKKRNPRKTRWTKAYRMARNKDLSQDLSLTFEARRSTLPKYNREALTQTVEAMRKIVQVRQKRQASHILKRLAKGTEMRRLADVRSVEQELHLVQAPHATRKIYDPDTKRLVAGADAAAAAAKQQRLDKRATAKAAAEARAKRAKLRAKAGAALTLDAEAMETEDA
ncbi:hypothetical protein BOX15_Mlig017500g4, partial [Macrostomum lignano]